MIQSKNIKSPQLVMIVDDQETNRDVLGMILEDYYDIIYACDGREALEKIAEYFGNICSCSCPKALPPKIIRITSKA